MFECYKQIINHESSPWTTDYKESWHDMDSLHTQLPSITDPASVGLSDSGRKSFLMYEPHLQTALLSTKQQELSATVGLCMLTQSVFYLQPR